MNAEEAVDVLEAHVHSSRNAQSCGNGQDHPFKQDLRDAFQCVSDFSSSTESLPVNNGQPD